MSKICIRTTRPTMESTIFIPLGQLPKRIANSTFINSILHSDALFTHVMNDTDTPIQFHTSDYIGTIESGQYYDLQAPSDSSQAHAFFNLVAPILKKKGTEETETDEQRYQDRQHDLSYRPKLAEIPDSKDIPTQELLSSLDFNPKLSTSQRKTLERIVFKNQKAFALDGWIGEYSDIKYAIKLTEDAVPISMPPYHASPEKRANIDKQIDKWFSQGVIRESDSPWGAPVIVVYHNGKARVCIDYQRVNAVTLADEYPLPQQTNILCVLSGSQWLSTFDVLSGFHQLEIIEEHCHITAFHTHKYGLLEFMRLPFGLRNRPAVFQYAMNKVLAKFLWLFILVYIDDIVVYSQTFEQHAEHLDSVLRAIANANITLSLPKCHLGYQSLILLGQRVSRLGISTHTEKIDAVDTMKPPTKVKELQMFLSFVNYFANYILFVMD